MVKGLVLIRLSSGKEKNAISQIKRVSGVKDVTATFGSWDCVAHVEAEELRSLASLIVSRIRDIAGVSNTDTLIEVKIDE
ncbi:MAG: Lrp/AsnC ligand binding domain-containing protein [Candidatus Omnitrophota bacterium]